MICFSVCNKITIFKSYIFNWYSTAVPPSARFSALNIPQSASKVNPKKWENKKFYVCAKNAEYCVNTNTRFLWYNANRCDCLDCIGYFKHRKVYEYEQSMYSRSWIQIVYACLPIPEKCILWKFLMCLMARCEIKVLQLY